MAEEAFRTGLTDELTFAATVWALLIATLISPLIFRQLMAKAAAVEEAEAEAPKPQQPDAVVATAKEEGGAEAPVDNP